MGEARWHHGYRVGVESGTHTRSRTLPGKEATVYCCEAHPSTGVEYLAAKVYRPRMFRSLRNDAIYRFSRVQRDEQGQAEHGNSRRGSAATRKTEKGRAARCELRAARQ
jgi:RIO kinase 1